MLWASIHCSGLLAQQIPAASADVHVSSTNSLQLVCGVAFHLACVAVMSMSVLVAPWYVCVCVCVCVYH